VFRDRVAEEEKSGKKLSKAEKTDIYNQVVEDMDKGYLTTGEIEAALGGETYKKYQESKSREEAWQKEYDQLGDLVDSQMTAKQKKRFRELEQLLDREKKNTSRTELQAQLGREVSEMVKADRLAESYNERGRKSQAFRADLSRYDAKQRATVQAAMDSGILNNTNRTHEFVDLVAKVAADHGLKVNFADNKKLKESGFALDGVTVNGFVNQDGITINVNSAKALNSVVGHEITHVLEGDPELYKGLETAIVKFAKTKGEYAARLEQLTKLYEGKEGYTGDDAAAKIQRELVADLVGDYLFTDKAFVESLSREHRNVFQKIYDQIKYLCKVATAGSKEARQLEKVKKVFQEAYWAGTNDTVVENGVKYSLAKIEDITPSKEQREKNLRDVANMKSVHTVDAQKMIHGEKSIQDTYREYFAEWGENIHSDVFGDIAAKNSSIRSEMRHGSTPVKIASIEAIPSVIQNGKIVEWFEKTPGLFRIIVAAPIEIGESHYFMGVMLQRDSQNQRLYLHDVVIEKEASELTQEHLDSTGPQESNENLYASSILDQIAEVKRRNIKNSLSAQGQTETAGGWEVQGRNVALEDGPGFPLPPGYQEGASVAGSTQKTVTPAQEDREISFPMPEDAARVEEQEDGLFPLPEDITLQEQRQLDAEYRQRMGEDPTLYDTDEDEGVETTRDKLEVKQKNLQRQLQENLRLKESTMQIFDKQIEELQAKYDGKKHKESKNSQALLRRIQRLKRQKSDRAAEYDQTIGQIQNRIGKLEEKLQTGTPEKTDRLEKTLQKIDEQLEYDEQELAKQYHRNRVALQKDVGSKDRDTWIRDKARELHWEMSGGVKGETSTGLLKALLNTKYDWKAIRYALEDIKDEAAILPSPVERTVREMLGYAYEYRVQDLEDLDTQYQEDLEKLRKGAQEQKDIALQEQRQAGVFSLPEGYRNTEALAANGNAKGKQHKWVKTSTESDAVGRAVLLEDLDENKITYTPVSNKETLGKANAKLYSMGYDTAASYFNNQIYNDKVGLDDIAMGERLIQEALKRGDTKTAGELIQNVAILGTELGQKVQALFIIKRLTPEGQLGMLQKIVNRGKAKGDVTFDGVEITQEMIEYILSVYNKDGSYDQKKLNKAVEDVKQKIADQMTVTKGEKVNAWRYLSMLGNPKTHIRNVVSNIANMGTIAVKDVIARTAEGVFSVENRTKTWKKASDLVKTYARETATEMKNEIAGEGKYSDTADIKAKRQIFQNSVLQKVYDFNSDMLSKEDWWFSKVAFQNSLQEFLAANGIETAEDINNNPEIVEKAKRYALERAEIATFRQYSWLASKISSIERKNTAFGVAVGAVIPFKKTPVNVAKAGLSYSPLGFAKTLTYDIAQVKKGNMDASTLVDHLAQNLTGTGWRLPVIFWPLWVS